MANILSKWWGNSRNASPNSNNSKDLKGKTNTYSVTSRSRQDISKWRDAIVEADGYYKFRVKMQGIFKDTILNGHVSACISKRKNLTLLREFAIVDKKGNVDERATAQLKAKWFSDLISYTLDAQLYGYSLINWTGINKGKIDGLQIINREFINPDLNILSNLPYNTNGVELNSKEIQNWSLYCTTNSENGISKCGYGLLYPVAQYEIFLRNLMGQNGDFVERFGTPLITATTSKIDELEMQELETKIANIGSTGYIIKDTLDVIEYLEYSQAGDGYMLYENLEKRCEQKISKILLGHADALDSTPGKLGSSEGSESPSQIALNEIKTVDSNYVEYYINDFLIDKLISLGFSFPVGGKFVFLNNEEKEKQKQSDIKTKTDISTFLKNMSDAGYMVDKDWIETEMGIKLDNSEPIQEPQPHMQ